MQLNLDSRMEVAPSVVTRGVGGDTMLLDLDSGTYFGLDPIGGEVWKAIEGHKSLGEACDILEQQYEVGRDQLEQDVIALAGQLAEKGLVKPA